MIGTQELLIIFTVIMLMFGASKIPELARSMGKATSEFKKAKLESEKELKEIDKVAGAAGAATLGCSIGLNGIGRVS